MAPWRRPGSRRWGAADAAEALEVLAQRRVDVVVSDYHLPGIASLDVLAAIRGTAPGTSLIPYSGGMTDELAAEARDFDVRVVLGKPVSAERLIEAIRAAIVAELARRRRKMDLFPARFCCSSCRRPASLLAPVAWGAGSS